MISEDGKTLSIILWNLKTIASKKGLPVLLSNLAKNHDGPSPLKHVIYLWPKEFQQGKRVILFGCIMGSIELLDDFR